MEHLDPEQARFSRLLGTREVAERLGVSPRKVRELIAAWCLPTVQVGKRQFVREATLKWWLRNGTELARRGFFADAIQASREDESED